MAQEIENQEPLEGGLVKPQDPVKVFSTDKDPFHKTGDPITVHRALAEKLVASGKATKTAPKADKADEGGKKS